MVCTGRHSDGPIGSRCSHYESGSHVESCSATNDKDDVCICSPNEANTAFGVSRVNSGNTEATGGGEAQSVPYIIVAAVAAVLILTVVGLAQTTKAGTSIPQTIEPEQFSKGKTSLLSSFSTASVRPLSESLTVGLDHWLDPFSPQGAEYTNTNRIQQTELGGLTPSGRNVSSQSTVV